MTKITTVPKKAKFRAKKGTYILFSIPRFLRVYLTLRGLEKSPKMKKGQKSAKLFYLITKIFNFCDQIINFSMPDPGDGVTANMT